MSITAELDGTIPPRVPADSSRSFRSSRASRLVQNWLGTVVRPMLMLSSLKESSEVLRASTLVLLPRDEPLASSREAEGVVMDTSGWDRLSTGLPSISSSSLFCWAWMALRSSFGLPTITAPWRLCISCSPSAPRMKSSTPSSPSLSRPASSPIGTPAVALSGPSSLWLRSSAWRSFDAALDEEGRSFSDEAWPEAMGTLPKLPLLSVGPAIACCTCCCCCGMMGLMLLPYCSLYGLFHCSAT